MKIVLASWKQTEFYFMLNFNLCCLMFFHYTFSGFTGYHNIWRLGVEGLKFSFFLGDLGTNL